MNTYLTTSTGKALTISKKAGILSAVYNNEFDQKGLEKKLQEETDEEMIQFILKRINPNFCLGVVVKFAASKNSSIVTAGIAFNRIGIHKDYKIRRQAYKIIAEHTPHEPIRKLAYRYAEELGKIVILADRVKHVRPKPRKNTCDSPAIIIFFPIRD